MIQTEISGSQDQNSQAERQVVNPLSSITELQFKTPFTGIPTPFRADRTDIRSSFAETTIMMFEASRGNYEYVIAIMDWMKSHQKSDLQTTFKNYLSAGGWKTLSEREQNLIETAFNEGHKHHPKAPKTHILSMGETLDTQARAFSNNIFIRDNKGEDFTPNVIAGIGSFEGLRRAIDTNNLARRTEAAANPAA